MTDAALELIKVENAPPQFEAVQLTHDNVQAVSVWLGASTYGFSNENESLIYFDTVRKIEDRVRQRVMIPLGMWIIKTPNGVDWLSPEAFESDKLYRRV